MSQHIVECLKKNGGSLKANDPIIIKIVQLLVDDNERLYKAHRELQNEKMDKIMDDIKVAIDNWEPPIEPNVKPMNYQEMAEEMKKFPLSPPDDPALTEELDKNQEYF